MRLYISGAIGSPVPAQSNTPSEYMDIGGMYSGQYLRNKFYRAQEVLEGWGHEVVNPLLTGACSPIPDGACGTPVKPEDETSHSWECYMKYDLRDMLLCEGVYALSNWKWSRGARMETELALALNMPTWQQSFRVGDDEGYEFLNTQIRLNA